MRTVFALASLCASAALAGEPYAVVKGPQGEINAPLFDPAQQSLPIAKVADQVVTLRELSQALTAMHEAHAPGAKATGTDFKGALDRLIGVRLVLIEAHEMGIDELPEVQEEMKAFSATNIRAMVQRAVTKDAKPDPKDVARRYKEAVREWRVLSALFPKEPDAKAAAAAIKGGKPFEKVVAEAVQAKKARGGKDVQALSAKLQVLPQVLAAVQGLKVGGSTGAIAVDKGWTVLKLKEIAYPEDAAARAEAEKQALAAKKAELLRKYYDGLVAKYVKVDEALFKSLDFEAPKPGFDALKKDTRVLATVQGEGTVSVAEVCAALETAFFHGIPEAITQKKVNKRARDAMDSLVSRKLVAIESRKRKLEETEEHRQAMEDHKSELVFGMFVSKAIEPGVNVTEGEGMKEYEAHKSQYVFPGFYTLSSIAFDSPQGAQAGVEKLKSGADFKWLRANASGQIPDDKASLHFDGNTVTAKSLPPDLRKALEGARDGDLRIFSAADGAYLIVVNQVTAPAPQPYTEVRSEILLKLRQDKITRALDDWIARLRKARAVQVYITRIAI